ncbi:hypothetical protein BJF93_12315 [Xaviernesmea oryzae]|uniref:Uncharacterized protein n=1 Tax=Xaviernesmea oryzae TaxID=464029 RepID=A0A1Q9AVL0_9HYPH|nr:hypothetical protein BJF93_12315 [Xaviernesmea oryzae]
MRGRGKRLDRQALAREIQEDRPVISIVVVAVVVVSAIITIIIIVVAVVATVIALPIIVIVIIVVEIILPVIVIIVLPVVVIPIVATIRARLRQLRLWFRQFSQRDRCMNRRNRINRDSRLRRLITTRSGPVDRSA